MKRNVLLLCHGYEAPFLSVANQYAALFKNTDFRVITVFIKGQHNSEIVEQCGADEVIFLDATSKQMRGLKRQLIKKVRQLHQQYQFEFVIAHRYKSIYIASHIKHLFVIGVAHIDGVFSPFMRKLFAFLQQKNLLLLGVSKAIRDDIRKSLFLFDDKKVQHLYNSLDFDSIRQKQLPRDEARRALSLPDDHYLFVNVGRLHEDKDQTTLIKAFAHVHMELPNTKLVLAGKGRLEQRLKSLVNELNLTEKVIFLGMVPEFYKYLNAFDTFVLSSIREGLPVSLLEAFAAEQICIASECNGNAEAISEAGYSFPVGDDKKLAEHLKTTFHLNNAERTNIIIKVNKKISEHFTESAVRQFFWSKPELKKRLKK